MKSVLTVLIAFILLLEPNAVQAAGVHENAAPTELPHLSSYALYDCGTKDGILAHNAELAYNVAGLSKLPAILTLCQAMDEGAIEPAAEISVSKRAAGIPGPTAFLSEGESVAAEGLMKSAVMIAAGDAIYSLAESAYGSESVFLDNIAVTLREAEADIELSEPLGQNVEFTAETLFRLGCRAAESETFTRFSRLYLDMLSHADGRETELVSANRMVRFFSGCDGLLTGSSQTAGYCGIFHAVRNGMSLICVIIGAKDAASRTTAAETLFNYGFSNYVSKKIAVQDGVVVPAVPVRRGAVKSVNLISKQTEYALLPKSAAKLKEERDVPSEMNAPVSKDQAAGSIRYIDEKGMVKAVVTLYPDTDIERFGLIDILRKIISDFVR